VFFCYRQHSTRSTSWVVDGEVLVRDGNVQQLNHQADDFTRSEMFLRLLHHFVLKPAEQFFVDIAHLQIRDLVRADLQFLVLVENWSEPVVLHHLTDGRPVVEVFDDVVNILGEALT